MIILYGIAAGVCVVVVVYVLLQILDWVFLRVK